MHVEYEISEQDYLDGQRLAIKNSSLRLIRWTRFVMPCFGAFLLAFLANGVLKEGFSLNVIPGLAFVLFLLFIPLLSKRKQKSLYAKSNALHGRLTLDVDDSGMRFGGPITAASVGLVIFQQIL